MKKLLMVCTLCISVLSGCGSATINDVSFSMQFNQLNKDDATATFTVTGLPNDEEFAQISQVIVDSLKAQELKPTERITVTVKSPDLNGRHIDFGTCVYQDGKIVENNIHNITEEEYKNYIG